MRPLRYERKASSDNSRQYSIPFSVQATAAGLCEVRRRIEHLPAGIRRSPASRVTMTTPPDVQAERHSTHGPSGCSRAKASTSFAAAP